MKNFDKWNELKKEINKKETILKFKERDIFFMHIGQNIGYEQQGKGDIFLRPVLIFRKFSNRYFLGIPLSSKEKIGSYFFNFTLKNKQQTALLNQVRVFDIKRAKYFFAHLDKKKFEDIKKTFIRLLTPQEGSGLKRQNCSNIVSYNNKNINLNEFNKWNELKKEINNKEENIKFRARDIFFMHIGQNIGYEQNGKGDEFLRPVIIYKKLSNRYFIGIPLSSKEKIGNYFFNFFHKNKKQTALFNQIRVFDIKRKKFYFGRVSENTFQTMEKRLLEFMKVTSQKGKDGPLGQNCNSILSRNNINVKSILFDLDMPKWVLFFNPIIKKLKELGHNVIITSRGGKDYTELNKVIELYNLDYISIGKYGTSLEEKLRASIERTEKLIEIVKNVDIVISGSVVDVNRVAFGLGKKVINFEDMPTKDYKDDCQNITALTRLTAPFSTILYKPFMVPDEIFKNLGVCDIREYNFIDPLIWLKDFEPNIEYVKKEIPQIDFNKKIVIVREEEFKASYVGIRYNFLDEAIKELEKENINLIIIPRYEATHLKEKFKKSIILEKKIILQHLLAFSDLFIGGGGTINIEATYFGVPIISTRSFITHYDKFLIDNNLMWHSNDTKEIINLAKTLIGKKTNSKEIFDKMEVDIDMFVKGILE